MLVIWYVLEILGVRAIMGIAGLDYLFGIAVIAAVLIVLVNGVVRR